MTRTNKNIVWCSIMVFAVAINANAQGQAADTSTAPRRCTNCPVEAAPAQQPMAPGQAEGLAASRQMAEAAARHGTTGYRAAGTMPMAVMPPPQFDAGEAILQRTRAQLYAMGAGRLVLDPQTPAYVGGTPYANPAYAYGAYGHGYRAAGAGYGYGYGWSMSPDQMFRTVFRNPAHLENHGVLKVDGPDGFLRKVRVVVDGADIAIASKHNDWWNKGIPIPAGEVRIDFIREEDVADTVVTRPKVLVVPAAVQLAMTGKIEPTWLRISQNEVDAAERRARSAPRP